MIDGESFEEHAKWGFQNGAIVNFYWEAKNPSNSADSYNGNNNPISEITEGGAYNGTGMVCLDWIVFGGEYICHRMYVHVTLIRAPLLPRRRLDRMAG